MSPGDIAIWDAWVQANFANLTPIPNNSNAVFSESLIAADPLHLQSLSGINIELTHTEIILTIAVILLAVFGTVFLVKKK